MCQVNFDPKVAVSTADTFLFSKLKVFDMTSLLRGSTRTGMRYSGKSLLLLFCLFLHKMHIARTVWSLWSQYHYDHISKILWALTYLYKKSCQQGSMKIQVNEPMTRMYILWCFRYNFSRYWLASQTKRVDQSTQKNLFYFR